MREVPRDYQPQEQKQKSRQPNRNHQSYLPGGKPSENKTEKILFIDTIDDLENNEQEKKTRQDIRNTKSK